MGTRSERRLTFVSNIPTPYRNHSFAALSRLAQRRGIDMECLFMAGSEAGRYWSVDPATWSFRGRIFRGLHPRIKGTELHINPGIWREIICHPPTWLVIAGGWALPTATALILMHPVLFRRTQTFFWAEANYHYSTHSSGPVAWARRKLLASLDGLVIPGKVAEETLKHHWGVQGPRLLFYPNLIDEQKFGNGVADLRPRRSQLRNAMEIPSANRVLFWSARLDERTKGILNFLAAVGPVAPPGVTILLAGDGPDRKRIEALVAEQNRLDVRVLGHVAEQKVLECLAVSDAAILPSLRDPNPLSMIESLWSGLPVLMSTHCGNWPEAVEAGKNGWVVDPENAQDMRRAFIELVSIDRVALEQMGRRSRQIAELRFATEPATERLLTELETVTRA